MILRKSTSSMTPDRATRGLGRATYRDGGGDACAWNGDGDVALGVSGGGWLVWL